MLKLKILVPFLFLMASPSWADNIYLPPGWSATVNGTTITCERGTNPDPNAKWDCGCYFLNSRGAGVEVFATTRQRAEAKALPLCKQALSMTQAVECERM